MNEVICIKSVKFGPSHAPDNNKLCMISLCQTLEFESGLSINGKLHVFRKMDLACFY